MLFLLLLNIVGATFTPNITSPDSISVVSTYGNSTLYSIPAPGYDDPILLVDLRASTRYDIGFAYGTLLASQINFNFDALMKYIVPGDNALEVSILEAFLDFEWKNWLGLYTPAQFLEELQGVADGGKAAGYDTVGPSVIRGLVLSSFATDYIVFDVETLLKVECQEIVPPSSPLYKLCSVLGAGSQFSAEEQVQFKQEVIDMLTFVSERVRMGCSMFGVWGNRTQGGDLYTGRNLDWEAQTGIATNKLITVFHPPNGIVHATVGFAGLYGALTGMSAEGITVHEAGDDNYLETFEGFAWTLRLRDLMERASNLQEAQTVWNQYNNTMGLNHGIGSSNDGQFMALEVKAGYTAFFLANDPREANFVGPQGQHYGAPMPDALWRTNHAYDPEWLTTARHADPGDDTELRYMLIHNTIAMYEPGSINFAQAINITAVAGDKGGPTEDSSFVSCANASGGSNILSATYHPGSSVMYVAFENGFGNTHVPASCNYYVQLDMSQFFSP